MRRLIVAASVSVISGTFITSANADDFRLYSPAVEQGEIDSAFEYDGSGCDGHNQSPPLHWENPPAGTLSFAVSVHDPDAQTGSGFWHWRVVNIPADVTHVEQNAGAEGGDNLPGAAIQLRNDFGERAWAGMCPPPQDPPHDYRFIVHALSVDSLDVDEDDSPARAGIEIYKHQIEEASFSVTYSRLNRD